MGTLPTTFTAAFLPIMILTGDFADADVADAAADPVGPWTWASSSRIVMERN